VAARGAGFGPRPLHAPAGATDYTTVAVNPPLSLAVLRTAVGFFLPTSQPSPFLGSLGEGFHGSAETACEAGAAPGYETEIGREKSDCATLLCVQPFRSQRTRLHGEYGGYFKIW